MNYYIIKYICIIILNVIICNIMSKDYISECKFWNIDNIDQEREKQKNVIKRLNDLENRLNKVDENVKKILIEDKNFVKSKEYKEMIQILNKFIDRFSNKNKE